MPHPDGYDVSHWNGFFPWDYSKAQGHRLAAYKAGTGNHGVDEQYHRNRNRTDELDFEYRGIYWWQLPHAQESLESQIAWWVHNTAELAVGQFLQIDQENPVTLLDPVECRSALDMLNAHYPGRVVHYGFGGYANQLHYHLKPYRWWRASATNLPPDDSVVILQYDKTNVPGVGLVDTNWIVDEPALRKLCGYTEAPITAIDTIEALERSQIGYRETPVNITKYATELDSLEHPPLPRQHSPWCGTFQDWAFRRCGVQLPVGNFWTPGAARWYHDHGRWSQSSPHRGDLAYLNRLGDHGHVGFVVSVNGGAVTTVEGNTTTAAAGSQANGGEVAIKTRPISFWEGGFGRPVYPDVKPPPAPGANDMTEFYQLDASHPDAEHFPVFIANEVTLAWIPTQELLAKKLYSLGWSPDHQPRQLAQKTDLLVHGVPVGPMPDGWTW